MGSYLEFADKIAPVKGKALAGAQRRLAKAPSSWPTGHSIPRGQKLPSSKDQDKRRSKRHGTQSPAASSASNLSRSSSAPSIPKHLEPLSRCPVVSRDLMTMKPLSSSAGPVPMLRFMPETAPAAWWPGKGNYTKHVPVFVYEEPPRLTIDELLKAENPYTNKA